ncbi:MAG TPA: type I-U CRISPR-associated helicase/endonuclease Cas3 [Bryobacteraceae bacterium]
MSESPCGFFETSFSKLSGCVPPYPWQKELFARFINADWPDSLELPTGAGKTAILKIWLIALGWSLINGPENTIPRRLAWVVNRRVVVDQATDEAEGIANTLAGMPNDPLAQALRACSFQNKIPLAVSTLRGGKADNREWSRDPLTPAIIVGTVDMIGSRLLFRGYRDGRYYRPYHAGLLGVDTLIVNDESHLTPAFARLLRAVEALRPAERVKKPFRVLLVSATERGMGDRPFQHDVAVDAAESEQFRYVYEAEKRAWLHEIPDQTTARTQMIERALAPGALRTILFIEKPEQAADVARQIENKTSPEQVALLTGTMRGYERDRLKTEGAFAAFLKPDLPDRPYYLVATSAAEVGVNISGERMITLIQDSDRLLQRLGRLNRFGVQAGEAHIFYVTPKEGKENPAEKQTLEYLRALPRTGDGAIDVSCRSIRENPPPKEARSELPRMALLDDRLIGLWSQTTASSQGMPLVDHWLHGKQDDDYPETELAWRTEVEFLATEDVSKAEQDAALDRYRVLPHEVLKEPTSRLLEKLKELPEDQQGRKILFENRDGEVKVCSIQEITNRKKNDLQDGVILLPPGCGCIDRGMFQPTGGTLGNDVADKGEEDTERRRYLAVRVDGEWTASQLASDQQWSGLKHWREHIKGGKLMSIRIPGQDGEDSERLLVLQTYFKKKEQKEIDLKDHLEEVARIARQIARAAFPEVEETFESAGQFHDKGKNCDAWQIPMGGSMDRPLAKTKKPANPKAMGGYRHEFGSLLEALPSHQENDLLLHLIASHHGWARPYWEEKACHPEKRDEGKKAALEAAKRFSRLQHRYGPWGLAYLEALFKAADGIASELDGSDSA